MVEPKVNQRKRIYSWTEFDIDIKKLAEKIKKKYPNLTHVYGIGRGGQVAAVAISHLLDLIYTHDKDLCYRFSNVMKDAEDSMIIVDDICDSGSTMCLFGHRKTATLLLRRGSLHKPKIHVKLIKNDDWIIFPWEYDETL